MRILLGGLALFLAFLLLDLPMTRGMKQDAIAWVFDMMSGRSSGHAVAPHAPSAPAPSPPATDTQSASIETGEQSTTGCGRHEEKICDIYKRHSCGPITLQFSRAANGPQRCEQVTMVLPQAQVIPLLRRVRCVLSGENTEVQFSTDNYQPKQGPHDGDTIRVQGGNSNLIVFGHYEHADRDASVTFENVGPGGSVVLKCEAFGPS